MRKQNSWLPIAVFIFLMLLLSPSVKEDFKTAKLFADERPETKARVQKRNWVFYTSKLGRYLNKGKRGEME